MANIEPVIIPNMIMSILSVTTFSTWNPKIGDFLRRIFCHPIPKLQTIGGKLYTAKPTLIFRGSRELKPETPFYRQCVFISVFRALATKTAKKTFDSRQ